LLFLTISLLLLHVFLFISSGPGGGGGWRVESCVYFMNFRSFFFSF